MGSHLLSAFLQRGDHVTILKRSISNCRRIAQELDRCQFYDVDRVSLDEVFRQNTVDVVIHCATEYGKKSVNSVDVVNANLIFPLCVLDAAISVDCPYFVNTDTFFTKQLPERFCHSRALYAPEYTLSKYQFREWGRMRAIEKKINFVNLQMEHIYGPDDGDDKFIPFLVRSMRNNVQELNLTDGIQIRDFIHVDDVVTAYLAVLDHLEELSGYHNFEVGTGVSRTVREFAEAIRAEIGTATKLNFGSIPRKDTEIMFSTAQIEPMKLLDYQVGS